MHHSLLNKYFQMGCCRLADTQNKSDDTWQHTMTSILCLPDSYVSPVCFVVHNENYTIAQMQGGTMSMWSTLANAENVVFHYTFVSSCFVVNESLNIFMSMCSKMFYLIMIWNILYHVVCTRPIKWQLVRWRHWLFHLK